MLPGQAGRTAAPAYTPFRDRPGQAAPTGAVIPTTLVRPAAQVAAAGGHHATPRDAQGERPVAFQAPVTREQGVVYEWEAPGWGDVFKDLGLRCFEVALGAAAYAIGEEVWYYFRQRRIVPKNWKPPGPPGR